MLLQRNIIRCLILILLVAAAVYFRAINIYFQSDDFKVYIIDWMGYIRQKGTFKAFKDFFSNYSPLYLHLLSIGVVLDTKELLFVKTVDFIFEVFAAFWVYKIISLRFDHFRAALAAILLLLIPTIILNGSRWAQCDIIYASLAAAFVYYILKEKYTTALIYIGIAYAFKQQAIFIFPVLLLLLLLRKIKITHLLIVPVPFLLSVIPSILAGRDAVAALTIYFNQDWDDDKILSLNAPTVYNLFKYSNENYHVLKTGGIIVTAVIILCLVFAFYRKGSEWVKQNFVWIVLLFSLIAPFFLPRMHERYFILAEVFSLIAVFYYHRHYYLPFLIIIPSVCTYSYYFSGNGFLPLYVLSLMELAAIVVLMYELFRSEKKEKAAIL